MSRPTLAEYQSEIDSLLETIGEIEDPDLQEVLLGNMAELELRHSIASCQKCALHSQCTLPVPFSGTPDSLSRGFSILGVGEAPGAEDDKQGEPFAAASGQLLGRTLKAIGLHIDGLANVVSCHSSKVPTRNETLACRPNLAAQIKHFRPWLTICFGAAPLAAMRKDLRITRDHGVFFRSRYLKNIVCENPGNCFFEGVEWHCGCSPSMAIAVYHPSYVLRNSRLKTPEAKEIRESFVTDLKHIAAVIQCREMLGAEVMATIADEAIHQAPYIPGDPVATKKAREIYLNKLDSMDPSDDIPF